MYEIILRHDENYFQISIDKESSSIATPTANTFSDEIKSLSGRLEDYFERLDHTVFRKEENKKILEDIRKYIT